MEFAICSEAKQCKILQRSYHVEHFPELPFEERHHRTPLCGFSSHYLNAALAGEALSCKKVLVRASSSINMTLAFRRFQHICCGGVKGSSCTRIGAARGA